MEENEEVPEVAGNEYVQDVDEVEENEDEEEGKGSVAVKEREGEVEE